MRRLRRIGFFPFLAAAFSSGLAAQSNAPDHGTIVIVTAREAISPIPTLWSGDQTYREVSDLMFLRLADLGPDLKTTDESSFVPRLAKSWKRRGPLTLEFELDPRARWHDGAPVTAGDVVFTFHRIQDHPIDAQTRLLVSHITSVTAEGDHRVVMKFDHAYPEQMYDATYHLPPLPEHLLGRMPAESVLTSSFAASPVGNGPYKWKRRVPAQLIELAANPEFFLGDPRIERVLVLSVTDPEARLNLLLSGDADATDNVLQFSNSERLSNDPSFQLFPVRTLVVGYLLFNQRDPTDTAQPHPILNDGAVRRALSMALDRRRMAQFVFGVDAEVPPGPVSQMQWIHGLVPPLKWDTAGARKLLASRGWLDHDGNGVLDKDGKPLELSLIVSTSAQIRKVIALQGQEQLRHLGVTLNLDFLEPAVIGQRVTAGQFDLWFTGVTQDPTPTGLVQSWSCAGIGGTNFGRYCDPRVDSLITRAAGATSNPAAAWKAVLEQIKEDAPAAFVFAPTYIYAIHRRFEHVSIRPESSWRDLWKWSVKPGMQIARDRQ